MRPTPSCSRKKRTARPATEAAAGAIPVRQGGLILGGGPTIEDFRVPFSTSPRLLRPSRSRPEPGPRMTSRLSAAIDEVEGWLSRLEAMPGDRRAPLRPELPPEIAEAIGRTRRAVCREVADSWATSWNRTEPVSNSDAFIALLKAREALGRVAERYDARFTGERV